MESVMREVVLMICSRLRWTDRQLGRIVADSPPSPRPPGSNDIPNSSGEGSMLIVRGNPASH
jgi:hypothetical protein